MVIPVPTFGEICAALKDPTRSIEDRYRALFFAKSSKESMCEVLLQALDIQTSILLRHEIAYVLGQIGDQKAVARLRTILLDETEDEIVRHEAAEALGALRVHCSDIERLQDANTPIGQTCIIALETVKLGFNEMCPCQYSSKDPALGKPGATEADVPEAIEILLDETQHLFARYVAMFTLRNVGGPESAKGLSRALLEDRSSALLRHEVAFVLGQMEDRETAESLIEALNRVEDHGMVRHEAAIALGSIGTECAKNALVKWSKDEDELVSESCLVGLAMISYWEEWDALESRISNLESVYK